SCNCRKSVRCSSSAQVTRLAKRYKGNSRTMVTRILWFINGSWTKSKSGEGRPNQKNFLTGVSVIERGRLRREGQYLGGFRISKCWRQFLRFCRFYGGIHGL